ncbi:MAG: hypothetical protein N2654_05300 [Deltaproteobacteria bacterium]|nr:hypothetical protein [Deltaproteobacteria bacterium]
METVKPVEKVAKIEKTEKIARVKQPTVILSPDKRAEILKIIEEEAKQLVEKGLIPERDQEVITKAVEYAIEGSLVTPEEEES